MRLLSILAMRAWCRRPGLNWRPLRYECTALPLRHAGNEIHKRPVGARPIEKSSLPETTVCRSTKGDQYRISGPSYVLAGTAILKRNHFTSFTRPCDSRGESAGFDRSM